MVAIGKYTIDGYRLHQIQKTFLGYKSDIYTEEVLQLSIGFADFCNP